MATARSKVQNFKNSQSSLLSGSSGQNQRQRTRSRSRQRMAFMDSEFVRKVDEYPLVHSTMEYLMATYGVIKGSNPLLKAGLQRSEDTALWMKQQTDALLAATNLDEPLKKLDSAAAQSITAVEQKTMRFRNQLQMSNAELQSRVRNIGHEFRKKSDNFKYQILESIQTLLDHVEDSLEPIMIPPSKEALKYSEDVAIGLTLKRILDISYRLNAGTVRYSIDVVKKGVDPEAWRAFLHKNFHPGQLQARFIIVRKEILAPVGDSPNYISNKELTALDRRVISASRMLIETTAYVNESMKQAFSNAGLYLTQSFITVTDVLKQLVEARSVRDVQGIGYHETRRALEATSNNFPVLKNNVWITAILDWLALFNPHCSGRGVRAAEYDAVCEGKNKDYSGAAFKARLRLNKLLEAASPVIRGPINSVPKHAARKSFDSRGLNDVFSMEW